MAINYDDPNDPLNYAQRRPKQGTYTLPAVNQMSRNTAFARNAPVNTIAMNQASQVPVGGFALGYLQGAAGYSRSPQMSMGNFYNQATQQPPTLKGYHWYAGTGGLQGGNNASATLNWSNGTRTGMTGGLGSVPALGSTPTVPQPTQYTLPGVNNVPDNALADPSVGAVQSSQVTRGNGGTMYQFPSGGFATTANIPSMTRAGSTFTTNAQGQNVQNLPSGGQAITSKTPSVAQGKPYGQGQIWMGGWY